MPEFFWKEKFEDVTKAGEEKDVTVKIRVMEVARIPSR